MGVSDAQRIAQSALDFIEAEQRRVIESASSRSDAPRFLDSVKAKMKDAVLNNGEYPYDDSSSMIQKQST